MVRLVGRCVRSFLLYATAVTAAGPAAARADGASDPTGLTSAHRRLLAAARAAAPPASAAAEAALLRELGGAAFRAGALLLGDLDLFKAPAEDLLQRLKTALHSLEWTSNFGVDEDFRKSNPGEPAMNLSTMDAYGGRIPSMWELKADGSSLVSGTPEAEWRILDAAETGLYGLPAFSGPSPVAPGARPQASEAAERPQYLAGNLRRQGLGVPRYGAYAAVLRASAVAERGLVLSSDSGGWTNICNASVTPIQSWFKAVQYLGRCAGMLAGGAKTPVPATPDHLLHALLGNTQIFEHLGGSLPRVVHQLLSPGATVHPLETVMYLESGLLGYLRVDDMKLMVASFPGLIGTNASRDLRHFCARHGVPLAWAVGDGRSWSEETADKMQWVPFSPSSWPVGEGRLLDPASWRLTNASARGDSVDVQVWAEVENEIADQRRQGLKSDYQAAFLRLQVAGGIVLPLRGATCVNVDLCFGVVPTAPKGEATDCVCRLPPQERPLALPQALTSAVQEVPPSLEQLTAESVIV